MAFSKKDSEVIITPANLEVVIIRVKGTAPYVQNKFSRKAQDIMMAAQMAGSAGKTSRKKAPRDFDANFRDAQHIAVDGWHGIPATAFRASMVDACRTIKLSMVMAKMALFVLPDGFDMDDASPLVKLIAKPPEKHMGLVRNDSGVADIRCRPIWKQWQADVTIQYDADILTKEMVANLLDRAGQQVGIGEGRPFSKDSVGQGWGTFIIEATKEVSYEDPQQQRRAA